MCPVEPGSLESLKTRLDHLHEEPSPLHTTGRTHFLRWVVIEGMHDEDGMVTSDELTVPYLLFSAVIDGDEDSYFEQLVVRNSESMHGIWSHCIGYPRQADDAGLVTYLRGKQIRTNLLFSPYPRATVEKVSSAIGLRKAFIEFAVSGDGMPAAQLRHEFRTWYDNLPAKVRS
jgi:hypothetical protein